MPLRESLLIAVPAWDGIRAGAQEAFCAMVHCLGLLCPDVRVHMKIVTRREQFRARNELVKEALRLETDWVLFLDDDMLPPPDLFVRLARHDQEICGGLYWQRSPPHWPVAMRCVPEHIRPQFLAPNDPALQEPGLCPVDVIGGGCMLVKTSLLRQLTPPVFWPDALLGMDVGLCLRLRQMDIPVWLDSSVRLGHLGSEQVHYDPC